MKTFKTLIAVAALAMLAGNAAAKPDADIEVMTQNQYLGADLSPIIAATSPQEFNAAVISALITIANNNYPERAQALAESISDKQPHLVALQEMFAFSCNDFGSGQCALFAGAFNDHLAETMAALGGEYEIAAVVQNLTLPGLPVFLAPTPVPSFVVSVIDRDVILRRADVETEVVDFNCFRPSIDGCNFNTVANAGGLVPVAIERGFVGVDATIGGADYRFINTHLEVKLLGGNPLSAALQAVQASELWGAILGNIAFNQRLIVAGDINSSPTDPNLPLPDGSTLFRPYQQFATGVLADGTNLPFPLTDIWGLRPGNPDGFTCCELADLSNAESVHDERIDVIFAYPAPAEVKANVLDDEPGDKTASGKWPSDHSSVSAELSY